LANTDREPEEEDLNRKDREEEPQSTQRSQKVPFANFADFLCDLLRLKAFAGRRSAAISMRSSIRTG
jgi:hypothetical protein